MRVSNNQIKIPPIDAGTQLRYDSVTYKDQSSDWYIIYDGGRAYPEYLITYSTEKKPRQQVQKVLKQPVAPMNASSGDMPPNVAGK